MFRAKKKLTADQEQRERELNETDLQRRERSYREHFQRPDAGALIALNQADREAARHAYEILDAVAQCEYRDRTGGKESNYPGLGSSQVVDELIHAINISRVKQAESRMWPFDGVPKSIIKANAIG